MHFLQLFPSCLSKTEEGTESRKRSSSFVSAKEPTEAKRRKSKEKPKTVVLNLDDPKVLELELLKDLQKARKKKKRRKGRLATL